MRGRRWYWWLVGLWRAGVAGRGGADGGIAGLAGLAGDGGLGKSEKPAGGGEL